MRGHLGFPLIGFPLSGCPRSTAEMPMSFIVMHDTGRTGFRPFTKIPARLFPELNATSNLTLVTTSVKSVKSEQYKQ